MTEQFQLKDSGSRREFSTGSRRDAAEGKGRHDLLVWPMIDRDAVLMEKGALKYGENNWQKGQPLSVFINSAFHHLIALAAGKRDEDHAAAARWNIAALEWTLVEIQSARLPESLMDGTAFAGTIPVVANPTAADEIARLESLVPNAPKACPAGGCVYKYPCPETRCALPEPLRQRPDENAKQHRDRVNSPWPSQFDPLDGLPKAAQGVDPYDLQPTDFDRRTSKR